jgi:glycerophosphoryl diester phosphodiesterase
MKIYAHRGASGFYPENTMLAFEKALEASSEFHPIPTFDEYCRWVATTELVTNIELKSSVIYYPDLEQKTLEVVKAHGLEKQIFVSSFNHLSLSRAKSSTSAFHVVYWSRRAVRYMQVWLRYFLALNTSTPPTSPSAKRWSLSAMNTGSK